MKRTLAVWMVGASAMGGVAQAGDFGHLDIYGTTRFPLTAGVGARVEVPMRLQFSAAGGMVPDAYSNALASTVTGLTGGEEIVGAAVDVMLARTNYIHLGAGWRPFRRAGLVFAGGVQRLRLGGSVADINIEGIDLTEIPEAEQTAIRSTLNMVTAEMRYDAAIADRLVVSVSAGWMQTVNAQTSISVPDDLYTDDVAEAASLASAQIDTLYSTYFRSPTLGVAVGYRFF
ncbi:MAG: hypothetical protein AAFV53_10195 [Myxococcota bacterium]